MADGREQSLEAAAVQNMYRRVQSQTLDAYSAVTDKYTKSNKERLGEGGASAASSLERQGDNLTAAEDILGGIKTHGIYDSEASFAASREKGIQDKMRALGMLEAAQEEVTYDPMVAEFIDPLTGEQVTADSFEYSSRDAQGRAFQSDLDAAGRTTQADTDALRLLSDSYWERGDVSKDQEMQALGQLFGEQAGDMHKSWKQGKIDIDGVWGGLESIQADARRGMADTSMTSVREEYDQRASNAKDHATSYNTQQSLAQQQGDKQSSAAAEAASDLKQSINEDRQNLARRGAGGVVSGSRKARIDYGNGGSSRPV